MNPPQVYLCSPSWTLLPPPSPYPPSGSYQCTSPKHPVSCIEPGLATRFIHDIIHVSMPFSQFSPHSPSPTESIRLIYTSVSLLLSCTQGYCYRARTNNFTICMEIRKTSNSQSYLEKEEWNWRNQPTWLQALLQSHSYQDSMVLAQRQKYWSMEQYRKPRDKSTHIWTPYLWQRRQEYTMD